jgi:hypothetical protein
VHDHEVPASHAAIDLVGGQAELVELAASSNAVVRCEPSHRLDG